MITSITLSLDKRRSKKDGSYPLIFRLSHQGATVNISTKLSIPASDWNNRTRKIKKTYKGVQSVTRLNNELGKKKADFVDAIAELNDKNQLNFLSIKELKRHLIKENDTSDFCGFTDQMIDQMIEANRFGNAQIYKHTLSALKNFASKEQIQFEEITYRFLKRFETSHLKKGNSINGLKLKPNPNKDSNEPAFHILLEAKIWSRCGSANRASPPRGF